MEQTCLPDHLGCLPLEQFVMRRDVDKSGIAFPYQAQLEPSYATHISYTTYLRHEVIRLCCNNTRSALRWSDCMIRRVIIIHYMVAVDKALTVWLPGGGVVSVCAFWPGDYQSIWLFVWEKPFIL